MFKSKLFQSRYFHYFLILSLLLHIIFYLIFFKVGFHQHNIPVAKKAFDGIALSPEERKKRIQKHQELIKKIQDIKKEADSGLPASLKPRKSDFGWVFFQDTPSIAASPGQVQVPTTLEEPVAQAPTQYATELKPEKPLDAAQEIETKPQEYHPQQPTEPTEKKLSIPPPTATTVNDFKEINAPAPIHRSAQQKNNTRKDTSLVKNIVTTKKTKKRSSHKTSKKELKKTKNMGEPSIESLVNELNASIDEEQPEIQEQFYDDHFDESYSDESSMAAPSANIQARIDRIAHMQEQVSNFAPSSSPNNQSNTAKPATTKVRGAKSIISKEKRGIIALTKGFVENLHGEGEDDIERHGDDNKRPSFEEMKYISYETNINWCLQAAWKQNFAYNRAYNIKNGKAVIEFTINEGGHVTHSEILQSTGDKNLDTIIMKNLKFASPFSPLPKHFGVKNYTTGRIIQVIYDRFGM